MVYTSSFRLSGRQPGAVAIANGTRFWSHLPKYKPLVPPWHLVDAAKEGRLSPLAFDQRYLAQLRALDPRRVLSDLAGLVPGPDVILLCWEAPGMHCHRRLVADWLETELGIEVPELQSALWT